MPTVTVTITRPISLGLVEDLRRVTGKPGSIAAISGIDERDDGGSGLFYWDGARVGEDDDGVSVVAGWVRFDDVFRSSHGIVLVKP